MRLTLSGLALSCIAPDMSKWFGAFYSSNTKKIKYKAKLKILNLAKKITNIPIVAIGGINFENYKKLLLKKANFLAISSYIWNNKKYKPIDAIRKIKWKY